MKIRTEAGPPPPVPGFKTGDLVQHNEYTNNVWLLGEKDGANSFEYIDVQHPKLPRHAGGVFEPTKYHLFTGKVILSN